MLLDCRHMSLLLSLRDDDPSVKLIRSTIRKVLLDNTSSNSERAPGDVSEIFRSKSSVWVCANEKHGTHVVKYTPKVSESIHANEDAQREAALLYSKVLEHPNIIKAFEAFETTSGTYMCLEHAKGGDLLNFMTEVRRGQLYETEARIVAKSVFTAIDFMHKTGYLHCDVKLENVLLMEAYQEIDENSVIKLTDFGFCRRVEDLPNRTMGSLEYAAPELYTGPVRRNSEKSDVWACGVVLYTVIFCEMPFASDDDEDEEIKVPGSTVRRISQRIVHGRPLRFQRAHRRIHPSMPAMELLKEMLDKNAVRRPTISHCLNHDFILGKATLPLRSAFA